jgi:prolyl-tRNA synthetase
MKQSHLFSKTRKLAPKDEVAKNAELLIRAGFVHKQMAGVYAFLPLGLKVLNKISDIIREEMVAIGGVELQMTALQEKAIWEKTNRWSDDVVDNWFKTELKNETELGLGFTHEEPLTALMKEYVNSYRDLPFSVFQIQTKFRNESRAKSGLMRGREFLMKDLYSFSKDDAEHTAFYERAKQAYVNIFKRVGLGDRTYVTFAAGGTFSKYSHEFQTVTDAGEDVVYVDEKKGIAVNKEVYTDEVLADLGLNKADLVEKKAVEVGNIFSLGTKFSDAFELTYLDEKGEKKQVVMGSYGIGPSRLMGVIAELLSDEKGIIWPVAVAPFPLHLVVLGSKDGSVEKEAEALYQELNAAHVETLFDDRDLRPGEKFADSDLIGIPYRAVVSEKNLAQGVIELKNRKTGEVTLVKKDEFITQIKSLIKA